MPFPSRCARKTFYRVAKMNGSLMRVVRVRFAAVLGLVLLAFLTFQVFLVSWRRSPTIEEIQGSDEAIEQACRHPDLDLFNPIIQKHIHNEGPLKCRGEPDWVEVRGGRIAINPEIAEFHGRVQCSITYLVRVDDFSSIAGKTVSLTSEAGDVPLEGDFFRVKCESKGKGAWKNIMAAVRRDESAARRAKAARPPEHALRLNVLMLGLDSMSRLHYMRKLPKTYDYLTKELKAVVLKGYNIVGDGTPQALIPILTGSTEPELPETRKRMHDANHVNVYPFVWNNFSAGGYVTAFGEDCPSTGTFTYRLTGFRELPTDHYLRSFFVEAEREFRDHPRLCLGSKPRHVVFLEWLRRFYDAYPDVPKFAFGFHGELSHDDYNLVGLADDDIQSFLRGLKEDGILNNTLLILMSDHGHRFANIRETQQGKQEERLPFFALALPPWFRTRYPEFARNLEENAHRLTTPFDIHATFLTLLHPEEVTTEGDLSSRSISLFSRIPQERTCTMANIEPHWCACLSWAKVPLADPVTNDVGRAVVDFINMLTEPQRDLCEPLLLKEVTRIEKLQPNKALLKFRKNADKDGFVGEFSDDTKLTELIYQVQLRTYPSNAVYEASVTHSVLKNVFIVKEGELSRVNMYANQEHCIHDTFPNLRKYCYCKKQL